MKKAKEILTSQKKFNINLGLKRVKLVLALLDNPQNKYKTIHIAGTNGKGSTSKIINDILIENFKEKNSKIGLYTSPHLFSYTERIKVNNENISDYVFDRLINEIDELAKQNNIELTEFELLTVCAFYYFFVKKVDYAVIEVGLGGKYDATNVINPMLEVITTIDFDHTERLGDTINKIALQKAGIIKENSKVVVSDDNIGFETIKKAAELKKAKVIVPKKIETVFENNKNYAIINNQKLDFNLNGSFQKDNLSLAFCAVNNLDIELDFEKVKTALKNVKWPFRAEFIEKQNLLIDCAHNPNGVKALRTFLDENFKDVKKTIVFGCLKTKDSSKMLETLLKDEDEFIFYEFDYPSGLKFDELEEKYQKKGKKVTSKDEIKKIIEKEDFKVITGSIYMLGGVFIV